MTKIPIKVFPSHITTASSQIGSMWTYLGVLRQPYVLCQSDSRHRQKKITERSRNLDSATTGSPSNYWMTANKLKLNSGKTELLVLNARHRPSPPLKCIHAGTELIQASGSAKNIGVWFDDTLSMNKQVNTICKTAFYHLRNIATVRKFL